MTSKHISRLRNSSSLFVLGAASALLTGGPAHAFDAASLPQGGTVTGGAATIATSGNTLTVNQSSNRAVIDWRSFDIGAGAQANFNQPGAGAIAVNRVNAATDPTRIEGGLHANGQVWILNPNGVLFGKSARVDAAGVVATTANIDDKAFMAGSNRLQMRGGDSGQVVNEGHITVGEGGLAAFVAPSVRNSGTIRARVGRVALAAGDTYTLDLAGDRLVEIGLGAGKAVVDQSGKIVNEGGVITISAKAAGQAVDSLINMSGVADASSVRTAGGKIVLGADIINVAGNASLKADGTSGGTITAVADKTGNYAGSYSARGTQGDGGQVETSGKVVHVDSKIAVNTSAPKGKAGTWTLDPTDLTVQAGSGGAISAGVNDDAQSTVGADTVVAALASTNVTLQATNSITVNSAIDASGNGVAHNLTLADQDGGGLTVNLNAAITLKSGGVLSGGATVVNLTNGALIQNGNDVALANATVNLKGGFYAPGVTLSKSGLSLIGSSGAEIDVNPGNDQVNAVTIAGNTDGVTVSGLIIRGEVTGSYVDYAFGSGMSRGVAVVNGATNFTISGNDIRNVRVGMLVDGRNTGTITGNTIDNTKGAVLVQYTDAGVGNTQGYAIAITGNHQGAIGNEWGIDTHLNGVWNGTTIASYPGGAAPSGVQTSLLANSAANDGWAVQDLAYTTSNRTAVAVATNGSNANQGSARTPLATIQAGINAIVAGGTINVKDGTYVVSAANGYANGYLGIGKSLKLVGQSQAGVIIDARNAATYGIRVIGGTDSVSLSNFTLLGVAATNAYGIKVEDSTNFSIDHVTSHGAYKAQLDLNGVRGGTVNFVTADGTSNGVGAGSTKGAAIAITDSQNLTIRNSSVIGGAYGGIGIYQSNKPSGYSYQTNNVTIDGSNSFNANGAAHYNYVYTEDESASRDFGAVTIVGFDYMAGQDANPADTFRYFQRTRQGAIDYLDSLGTLNTGYVEGWTGSAGNNQFTVANASGGHAMTINPALAAAAADATITVAPGVYAETLNISKNVDIVGAGVGQTIIRPTALLSTGAAHKYDANVKATVFVHDASDVNLSGLTIDGNNLGNNAVVLWNNASGSISNALIENPQVFNGAQTGQDLAVDATGGTISNLTISGVQFANWNKNAIDVVTGGGSTSGGGNVVLNVRDSSFAGQGATGLNEQNGIVLWERGGSGSTINATVDHSSFSDIAYTGTDPNAAGVLLYGAATGSLTVKNSSFAGSVQKYIGVDGGSSVEVDATSGNIFDGVAQGGATLDQLFNIENRLVDGTDNAGNGLVRLKAGQVYVTAAKNSLQKGIDAATAGDTVNLQNGTYVGGGANGYFSISKSLSLVGQSQAGTIIDAHGASTYGLRVQADNVALSSFTLMGATGVGGFGIKVEPLNLLDPNSRINNFAIDHVTVNGSTKNALDLNGALHATIDHVTAKNATAGNGIAINDSANVTITNSVTLNNAWGGLRIEQHNNVFNQQTTGIVVNGTNTFNEATPVYLEDDSASKNFGTVEVDGFAYAAVNAANPADVYTLFQTTAQGAIDALGGAAGTGTVQGWTGTAGDNRFTVGVSTGGTVMSINAAVNAASTGAVITLSASEFNQGVTITKGLTLQGTDAGNRPKLTQGILLSGSFTDLSLRNLSVSGSPGSAVIQGGTVTNLTINNVKVDGGSVADRHGIASGQYGGNISITNSQFVNIAGWAVFDTRSGAGSTPGQDGTVITSGVFANNLIDNSQGSVNFRQASTTVGAPLTYPDITISGNTVTNVGNATNSFGGVFKAFNAGTVNFANNTVSGVGTSGFNPAGEAPYGAVLLTRGTSVLNVTGNTFTGNNMVYALEPGKSLPGSVTFADNSFINNAYGIYLPKDLVGAGTIRFTGTNNFVAGANTVQDIVWTNAAGLDLTNVQFGGKLGSQMSDAELFAEEDRITHGLDNGAYGLVLVKAGNVYVTQQSGSIQRGVDKTASGSLIHVADSTYAENVALTTARSIDFGNVTLNSLTLASSAAGSVLSGHITAGSVALNGAVVLGGDLNLGATGTIILASADGAHDLSITSGTGASLGNLGSSTRLGAVAVSGGTTLTGSSYKAGNFDLGAVTLASDVALDATGAITLASADGAHGLGIVTGTGASLGSLGSTTRLGAVSVSGGVTLTGSSYKAGSFDLGDVTLTAASTTLDTAQSAGPAGNITVRGNIFGVTDGGQSLVLAAGPGAGTKAANGDIVLNNVGVAAVRLGDLRISGDDFLALTVDIAGGFTSFLTGNQVFAADTLNAGGAVNTNAVGDVSGHIVAAGNVSLTAGGAVSGNISGDALTLNSTSVGNATLRGSSLDAVVGGNFDAAVSTSGNVSTNVTGNVSGQIASGGNVLVKSGGSLSGNITGNALTVNSGSVNGATLAGSSLDATVAGNFNAAVKTTGNVSTNVTGNLSGQIAAGGNVSLNAGGLVSGNISGNALTLNSGAVSGATLAGNTVVAIVTGNFDAAVKSVGSASVSGNNVTGSFSGSTVSLSGQSVNGQVNAGTLNVSAQDGAVTGNFTAGDVSAGLPLNGGIVGTNVSNYFPAQLVVEGFVLPPGTQIAANGQLVLPPGTVIGLLSPGGGAPRVTLVQSVQQLGELLEAGYTAIVIDLNTRKKVTRLAAN